jgi:hypothetical protein
MEPGKRGKSSKEDTRRYLRPGDGWPKVAERTNSLSTPLDVIGGIRSKDAPPELAKAPLRRNALIRIHGTSTAPNT